VIARAPILFLLLLSFALGPARFAAACAPSVQARHCRGCCTSPDHRCCAVPGKSGTSEFPASVVPQSQDEMQMVSPAPVFADASVSPVMESTMTCKVQVARLPARARVAVTGIRLI